MKSCVPKFIAPTVVIPTIRIPQPDGSVLIKAGMPVVVSEEIGSKEAAKILGVSQRSVEYQCVVGLFKNGPQSERGIGAGLRAVQGKSSITSA